MIGLRTARRLGRLGVAVAVGVALAVVAGLLALGTRTDDGPGPEQAELRVDGSATVSGPGRDDEVVTGRFTLEFGDTVEMTDGTAELTFADGRRLDLRAIDGSATALRIEGSPVLLAGDVLLVEGFPSSVVVDTEGRSVPDVTAQGVVRVDADDALAEVYTGRTTIAGIGDSVAVPALRQLLLSSAADPEPLDYDGADPWDRQYLGEAIAFGDRLEALARGYTSDVQRSGATRSASFFESVIPALDAEREFSSDLLEPARPAGEVLVGAAIAVQGRKGSFRDRWDAIFAFRGDGARWGLVALDQGVSSAPVLETIELAIGGSPLSGDPRPTTPTTRPPSSPPPTTGPNPAPTTTTTTTTAPPPPPPDDGGILSPILDPVGTIVEELLNSLGLG